MDQKTTGKHCIVTSCMKSLTMQKHATQPSATALQYYQSIRMKPSIDTATCESLR
jgi:hypothetical protein